MVVVSTMTEMNTKNAGIGRIIWGNVHEEIKKIDADKRRRGGVRQCIASV
jgi:hypothetical protein